MLKMKDIKNKFDDTRFEIFKDELIKNINKDFAITDKRYKKIYFTKRQELDNSNNAVTEENINAIKEDIFKDYKKSCQEIALNYALEELYVSNAVFNNREEAETFANNMYDAHVDVFMNSIEDVYNAENFKKSKEVELTK